MHRKIRTCINSFFFSFFLFVFVFKFTYVFYNVANIDPRTYDFTKDWSAYWVKRIQVYYNEALEKIINTIGANYILTVADTKTNGLLAKNNGQHSNGGAKDEHSVESKSNGIRANKDLDNGTVVPVNGTSANNAPANDDLKNSDCSNDNSNVDRFSITNSETVSNGDDNDNDEEDVNKIGKQMNVVNCISILMNVCIHEN